MKKRIVPRNPLVVRARKRKAGVMRSKREKLRTDFDFILEFFLEQEEKEREKKEWEKKERERKERKNGQKKKS